MKELSQIRQCLLQEGYTCVVQKKDGSLYTSKERGIKPLLQPLNQEESFFEEAIVADRVIGKSAALLLIKGKIRALHAEVISEYALERLKSEKIVVEYEELVPCIINRDKTGMCPMESSVLEIDNPDEAICVLNRKVKEMMDLK